MDKQRVCAAYIRVSTEDQLDFSPDSQISAIREYAKRNDLLLPDEFIFRDDGISGRTAKKRPGFMRMIAAAKEKPRLFEAVLVWKFSRFARNQEESIVYKSLLKRENGIEVISISEPITDGPFGELIERIIEWFDAFYSVNLSAEVKRGMTERVRQGGSVSAPPFGYAYENRELIPLEGEADTVRAIFSRYLAGHSCLSIAKALNKNGSKTKRGGKWEGRSVRYILTNPIYTGRIRCRLKADSADEAVLRLGKHRALISDSTFEAAQRRMKLESCRHKRITEISKEATMLDGLLRCSSCGGPISRCGKGRVNCSRYTHGRCDSSHSLNSGILENIIRLSMKALFGSLELPNKSKPYSDDIVTIMERIALENIVLQRVKDAYIAGIDTLEEYQKNKKDIESRINKLQRELSGKAAVQQVSKVNIRSDAIALLFDDSVSGSEKNRIMRAITDHIILSKKPEKIEIIFRV